MRLVMIGLAVMLAGLSGSGKAAQDALDHQRIDIPVAYRGVWALKAEFCAEPGPAVVKIGARSIGFYEDTGYLELANLNETDVPPEFWGRFSFVKGLTFYAETVRLNIRQRSLFISRRADDPDATANATPWTKCP